MYFIEVYWNRPRQNVGEWHLSCFKDKYLKSVACFVFSPVESIFSLVLFAEVACRA